MKTKELKVLKVNSLVWKFEKEVESTDICVKKCKEWKPIKSTFAAQQDPSSTLPLWEADSRQKTDDSSDEVGPQHVLTFEEKTKVHTYIPTGPIWKNRRASVCHVDVLNVWMKWQTMYTQRRSGVATAAASDFLPSLIEKEGREACRPVVLLLWPVTEADRTVSLFAEGTLH